MNKYEVAIFDLDNTIYDWYSAFIPAFYAMIDSAVDSLGVDRDDLLTEIQQVHVNNQDVEHPFSLLETPTILSLKNRMPEKVFKEKIDEAFYAFNKTRKNNLRLFPGTLETLDQLKAASIKVLAYTDSKYYSAVGRIEKLDLIDRFEKVYCRRRGISKHAPAEAIDDFRGYVVELPPDDMKPNPKTLHDILAKEQSIPARTAYVGDSLAKDIFMAKQAGCFSVWARFGAEVDPAMYEKLVRISHWTQEDIAREKHFRDAAAGIVPDFVCQRSLTEALPVLVN